MLEQPEYEVHRIVPGEVVSDQQHPERRQLLGEGDPDREVLLPALPLQPLSCRRRNVGDGGRAVRWNEVVGPAEREPRRQYRQLVVLHG
jgi:hypothetical protein